MKKVLFLIHDLGQGGAEKVLVNLVNHMDMSRFDITVIALFGGGINEQFLSDRIKYHFLFSKAFPGNSVIMKCFTPEFLHRSFIKEKYDIEVSYLEGPCARIISGCKDDSVKLVSWIHVEQHSEINLARSFRSIGEAKNCYSKFDMCVCVSEFVRNDFLSISGYSKKCCVLHNTVEVDKIRELSLEAADVMSCDRAIKLIAVGSLKKSKGYERMLRVFLRLIHEGRDLHLYILGIGGLQAELERYVQDNFIADRVSFLGYDINPYRYVSKADLFICASYSEGFSTAVTEALILSTPVCTVNVSGMKELLGEHNEYGVVTDNSEDALFRGIKQLLDTPHELEDYRLKAGYRGRDFDTQKTVQAVEEMLERL